MKTLCPKSGLRIVPNWPKIRKMAMTSQFSDMTLLLIFLTFFLFFLSSLVTGPSFMSISPLLLELWQFFSFVRDWPEIRKLEIPLSEFYPISGDWAELWIPSFKVGTNVCNRMLLNDANFQGYSFYRFWVNKVKPIEGDKITPTPPLPPRLGLKGNWKIHQPYLLSPNNRDRKNWKTGYVWASKFIKRSETYFSSC